MNTRWIVLFMLAPIFVVISGVSSTGSTEETCDSSSTGTTWSSSESTGSTWTSSVSESTDSTSTTSGTASSEESTLTTGSSEMSSSTTESESTWSTRSDSSTMPTDSSTMSTYSSTMSTDSSSMATASSTMSTDSSTMSTDSSIMSTDSSIMSTYSSTMSTDSSSIATASSTMSTDSSIMSTDSSSMATTEFTSEPESTMSSTESTTSDFTTFEASTETTFTATSDSTTPEETTSEIDLRKVTTADTIVQQLKKTPDCTETKIPFIVCKSNLEKRLLLLLYSTEMHPVRCQRIYQSIMMLRPPTIIYTGHLKKEVTPRKLISMPGNNFSCQGETSTYTAILTAEATHNDNSLMWMARGIKACDLLNMNHPTYQTVTGGEYEIPDPLLNTLGSLLKLKFRLYRDNSTTDLSSVTIESKVAFSLEDFVQKNHLCGPVAMTEYYARFFSRPSATTRPFPERDQGGVKGGGRGGVKLGGRGGIRLRGRGQQKILPGSRRRNMMRGQQQMELGGQRKMRVGQRKMRVGQQKMRVGQQQKMVIGGQKKIGMRGQQKMRLSQHQKMAVGQQKMAVGGQRKMQAGGYPRMWRGYQGMKQRQRGWRRQ